MLDFGLVKLSELDAPITVDRADAELSVNVSRAAGGEIRQWPEARLRFVAIAPSALAARGKKPLPYVAVP